MNKYPVVHIYGQHSHHMEVFILGNKQGLISLRNAINEAVYSGKKEAEVEVYCNDGEGYDVYIKMVNDKNIDKLPVPYTADYAQDTTGRSPASFFK
ncbi:MAG: hypothetical protein NUV76_12135 [Candidatus Kuenenia sp.]|nr:hypothetical protein [Candidatus Kuenenia sp.]